MADDSVKIWHFKTGCDKVQTLVLNRETMCESMRKMLGCATLGWAVIADPDIEAPKEHHYTIWFNDNGVYEDGGKPINKTALQVLSKLPIRWGTFRGDFFVSKTELDYSTEADEGADMTISIRDFIDKGRRALGA